MFESDALKWVFFGMITVTTLVKLWYLTTKGRFRSEVKMTGKTVLITGANRGLGKEIAFDLAKRNAKVIMACRDEKRAQETADDIKVKSGNNKISIVRLDLSDFESVRKCAQHILDTETRLNALVNNAGICTFRPINFNEDGIEEHYATNHFGHFLLTSLLLPLIIKSGKAKIVNLTSYFHFIGRIDSNDIYGRPGTQLPLWIYSSIMYANTKLANILFTRELAEMLRDTRVTVNAVNPGNNETDIALNINKFIHFFGFLIKWFTLKKAHEGAKTVAHVILSPEMKNTTGQYLSDCGVAFSSPASKNMAMRKWLWAFSERVTKSPNVQEIIKETVRDFRT